jgi:hypothetical protein
MKLFLFVLLSHCQLNFTIGHVKENRPWEILTGIELSIEYLSVGREFSTS